MFKSDPIRSQKWLILLAVVVFSAVAVAIPFVKTEQCDGCYELDKGDFRYVIYDGMPESTIRSIHRRLMESKPEILKSFNLKAVPKIIVRVWGNAESYLSEQEKAIGQRYPGSHGYVTLKRGVKAGEIRLFAGRQDLPETAVHEFVHVVTLEVNPSFANNPRWLWEAIAIYKSENSWKYAEQPDMIRGRFEALAQLLFTKGDTGAVYELGYTIGQYIAETWGEDALIELIESNGEFSGLTDKPIQEIFQGWKKFVEATYFSSSQSDKPNNALLRTIFPAAPSK